MRKSRQVTWTSSEIRTLNFSRIAFIATAAQIPNQVSSAVPIHNASSHPLLLKVLNPNLKQSFQCCKNWTAPMLSKLFEDCPAPKKKELNSQFPPADPGFWAKASPSILSRRQFLSNRSLKTSNKFWACEQRGKWRVFGWCPFSASRAAFGLNPYPREFRHKTRLDVGRAACDRGNVRRQGLRGRIRQKRGPPTDSVQNQKIGSAGALPSSSQEILLSHLQDHLGPAVQMHVRVRRCECSGTGIRGRRR